MLWEEKISEQIVSKMFTHSPSQGKHPNTLDLITSNKKYWWTQERDSFYGQKSQGFPTELISLFTHIISNGSFWDIKQPHLIKLHNRDTKQDLKPEIDR